jgi:hypothetical protein
LESKQSGSWTATFKKKNNIKKDGLFLVIRRKKKSLNAQEGQFGQDRESAGVDRCYAVIIQGPAEANIRKLSTNKQNPAHKIVRLVRPKKTSVATDMMRLLCKNLQKQT